VSAPLAHPGWCAARFCDATAHGGSHASGPSEAFHGAGLAVVDPAQAYEPDAETREERWQLSLYLHQAAPAGAAELHVFLTCLEDDSIPDDVRMARTADHVLVVPLTVASRLSRALAGMLEAAKGGAR
jgi:hypothetical protein